jgi:PPOX class probable F420-dependent enzyme
VTRLTDTQKAFVDEPNFAIVATVDGRGGPRTSVVWVDRDGDDVLFNTTTTRAKARHLARNPYASVLVLDRNDPHRWLEVQGPSELVLEGALEHMHRLAHKYTGADAERVTDRVTVRVHPERVIEYGL